MANEGNHGIGRRKTSVAQATIVRGTGQVTVNGRPLDEYFPVPAARIELLKPLVTIKEDKKFDVRIFTPRIPCPHNKGRLP